MQTNPEFKLTLPNDIQYLTVILGYVRKLAELAGFSVREQQELEIATEEAVTNVIRHAFAPGEVGAYDVRCEITPVSMIVAVHDQGIPFDSSRIPEFNPTDNVDEVTGAGLGGVLMKSLVDQVEYINLGSSGKETRLIKSLPFKSVSNTGHADHLHPPSAEKAEIVGEIEARLMKPEEAVEVARCFFDAYGYSYVYEDIYYPERIAALNRSGEMMSAVVVDGSGSVLSHGALLFFKHLPGVAEVAMGATRPRYQGHSLAVKLAPVLFKAGYTRKLNGCFTNAVCTHPYSQRIVCRAGFKAVCFLLAHSLESTVIKGIADKLPDRGSVVVYYLPLRTDREMGKIYLPERHQEMILDLYCNIGIRPTLGDPGNAGDPAGESEIELSINKRRQTAVLSFQHYGSDVNQRIHDILYRIKKEKVQVVEAYLNLTDIHTSEVADYLEAQGFIFTGILPGVDSGDMLVMQYFNGIVVDYDMIRLDGEKAAQLLEYIKRNDPMGVR